MDFFTELRADLGALPLIAEDLGDITPAVLALRKQAGLPGMNVLQFAFDGNTKNPYLPYNVERDSVMYTGTHDNNTSVGWFRSLSEAQRARVCAYLGVVPRDFIDSFLRAASSAPSSLCIIPLQDILHLDGDHRMNTPGTRDGNWGWRVQESMLDAARFDRLKQYTYVYGRAG
jgi:4-alpha-glucanotransferase